MKATKETPLLVKLFKFMLVMNTVSVSIIFFALTGSIIFDGFKTNFADKSIPVEVTLLATQEPTTINIRNSDLIFKNSNVGEVNLSLPFVAQFFTPLSFLPIFNLSPLNLAFYILTYFQLFLVLQGVFGRQLFLENVKKRLMRLGVCYVAWGLSLWISYAWIDRTIRTISENQLRFGGHQLHNYVETGLVVFIIAMVYTRGIELQKEADLVI